MSNRFKDTSFDNFIELALAEIEFNEDVRVRTNRKTRIIVGKDATIGTTEKAVNYLGIVPRRSTTNDITVASSTNAGDSVPVIVEVMYLNGDNNFVEIEQEVTLNGQSNVTLPQPLCRVMRIFRNGFDIAGDVYVHTGGATTGGKPNDDATVGNVMSSTEQSTLYAGFSTSKDCFLVITSLHADLVGGNPSGAEADIRLKQAGKDNNAFQTIDLVTVSRDIGQDKNYRPYIIIPPNSDVQITAKGSTDPLDIAVSFQGFFADIY